MRRPRATLAGLITLLAAGLMACTSPEADRTRGAGAGADVGNRKLVVEMHEGALPYHETPCVTTLPRCTGPLPASGKPPAESRR
jgi:hypothetical protein